LTCANHVLFVQLGAADPTYIPHMAQVPMTDGKLTQTAGSVASKDRKLRGSQIREIGGGLSVGRLNPNLNAP